MIKNLRSLLLAVMLGAPLAANASLIGQTANCDMQPNGSFWSCVPASAPVIDPGIEFQVFLIPAGGPPFFSVDIGAASVLLNFGRQIGMGAGEVLTISGLSGILNASLIFSQGTGFDAADVSFTSSSVTINMNNTSWLPDDQARVSVLTASTAVPEPATLALLGFGLVGLGLSRRRSKNS